MLRFLLVLVSVLMPFLAAADDAELYAKAPPPNSAFIRVLNAAPELKESTVSVAGKSFSKAAYPSITSYQIVPAGNYVVTLAGKKTTIKPVAGKFYSVAVQGGSAPILFIADAAPTNPAKSKIYFYNLSDASVGKLFAPDHKTAIVDNVKPGTKAEKDINALKVTIDAMAGTEKVQSFPQVQLKRRVGSSFLLAGSKGQYKAVMVENSVAR